MIGPSVALLAFLASGTHAQHERQPVPGPVFNDSGLRHKASPRDISGEFGCGSTTYTIRLRSDNRRIGQPLATKSVSLVRVAVDGRDLPAAAHDALARAIRQLYDFINVRIDCEGGSGALEIVGETHTATGVHGRILLTATLLPNTVRDIQLKTLGPRR